MRTEKLEAMIAELKNVVKVGGFPAPLVLIAAARYLRQEHQRVFFEPPVWIEMLAGAKLKYAAEAMECARDYITGENDTTQQENTDNDSNDIWPDVPEVPPNIPEECRKCNYLMLCSAVNHPGQSACNPRRS